MPVAVALAQLFQALALTGGRTVPLTSGDALHARLRQRRTSARGRGSIPVTEHDPALWSLSKWSAG
jgi:hypothetical protein